MRSSLLCPICSTFPANLTFRYFFTVIIFGEQYRSRSSLLCSFLRFLATSSHLGPNILLSTLFSNTLSLCSSLSLTDQMSDPHKTAGPSTVLYIFVFFKLEDRRCWCNMQQELYDIFFLSFPFRSVTACK